MIECIVESICRELNIQAGDIKTYFSSYCNIKDNELLMIAIKGKKYIAVCGKGSPFEAFEGEPVKEGLMLCPLTHANRLVLNKYLDYTLPKAFGRDTPTFGSGDRLGLASPGHIRAILKSSAKPILAQQSKRELELTQRNFDSMLDDVCFAVFQEGYKGGFGADGDHLKQESDILEALNCGYSMITIDCSERIGKGIDVLSAAEAEKRYLDFSPNIRKSLENKYLNRTFCIGELNIQFSKEELIRNVLIYYEAIDFVIKVYHKYISTAGREIDFEISIDETESTTTEYGHIFVATEIIDAGVQINSLAPRFVGEFQKGIDYIGDVADFEKQLSFHASIADFFGYKLSFHSGSDKFSIFNLIGKYTKGRFHIKTSGTSWLEAIGIIACYKPPLYRSIHKCALEHFQEAKQYYYVTTDLSKVPDIDSVTDDYLQDYLKEDNSRQLIHIAYGFILKDPEIKVSVFETIRMLEDTYYNLLEQHIGRHLKLVGL